MTKPVSVPIVGNAGPLRKELRGASDALGKFGTKTGNVLKGVGKTVGIAFAAIGAGAAVFAKDAIGAASNLNETISKTNIIFGEAATEVMKFSETTAKSIGQSQQEALDAAATFATFGKSAGLAGTDLTKFSTEFVTLASDIASFQNDDPANVVSALGSALRGEAEPMRRYGVLLDDATLKMKALEMGIYDGTGALTPQQKVLAAHNAILKQTTDAQGDFARTSDGLANSQRILKARFKDLSTQVGQKLLPVVNNAVGYVADLFDVFDAKGAGGVFGKLKDDLGKGFKIAFEWIKTTGIPLAKEKLAELGKAFVEWIGPQIAPALKELGKLIAKVGEWILTEAVPKLIEFSYNMTKALIGWTLELAPQILKGLGEAFIEIVKKLPGIAVDLLAKMGNLGLDIGKALLNGIVDFIENSPGFAIELGKALVNGVIDFINAQLIRKLNDLLEVKIDPPGPGSISFDPPDIPDIPKLARGGIVSRPTLAMIGEGRFPEAVVPLRGPDSTSLGGNTYITIEVNGGDPRAVVEALKKYQRQNGYIPITAQKVA